MQLTHTFVSLAILLLTASVSAKEDNLSEKAKKFEEQLTAKYWTDRVTKVLRLDNSCSEYKSDITTALVYAGASAHSAVKSLRESSDTQALFGIFYNSTDKRSVSKMLGVVESYGQNVKYKTGRRNQLFVTCAKKEAGIDFQNRLALTDGKSNTITLNSDVLFTAATKAKSTVSRATRLGYTFLQQLPQLDSYAKTANWPKDTTCSSSGSSSPSNGTTPVNSPSEGSDGADHSKVSAKAGPASAKVSKRSSKETSGAPSSFDGPSRVACPIPPLTEAPTKFSQSLIKDAQTAVCAKASGKALKNPQALGVFVFLSVSQGIYGNDLTEMVSLLGTHKEQCAAGGEKTGEAPPAEEH